MAHHTVDQILELFDGCPRLHYRRRCIARALRGRWSGSPRRAVVDRPASPDGDKVERPTGRTTLAPSGEAGSPCGARRGDPSAASLRRAGVRGGAPRSSESGQSPSVAGRPGRCRPEVASRPGPGRRGPLAGRLDSEEEIRQCLDASSWHGSRPPGPHLFSTRN